MAKKIELKGIEDFNRNVNKASKKIKRDLLKGMILGAIEIRRSMDKDAPKIPIDTGVLRGSWFVTTARSTVNEGEGEKPDNHSQIVAKYKAQIGASRKPIVALGFSANYAVYVHEMVDATFQRPGSGPKFFEKSLQRNKIKVIKLMQQEARV